MICRRDLVAGLIALALSLAGCAGGDGAEPAPGPAGDPDLVRILGEAEAAMAAGRLAEAGAILDRGLALAPDNPDLWVAIARLRLRGGEHLTALDAAGRALAFGPDHAPALRLRALLVRDAHGFAASLPWFEAALAAAPEDPDTLAEYAAALGDGGRASAMLAAVRRLAAVAPADPRVPYLQAVLAARAGEFGLARSLLARSGMAARGVPAALQLDAVIALAEGNAASAAATLEGLAARQPANVRVRELLAKALIDAGRADAVITRFAAEAARPGASPYLVLLVARAHESSGDRRQAAPLLARAYRPALQGLAVLLPGEGLPPPTHAARMAGLQGDWVTARAGAETLAARFPASADVAALKGDVLLGAGDPQASLAAYAAASRIKRPWPLTRKALAAYARSGDEAAAATLLARHAAGEPVNASALVALAQSQAARGEWGRSALLLDHAMMLGAGHDPALLQLRAKAARVLGDAEGAHRFAALLAEVRPPRLDKR